MKIIFKRGDRVLMLVLVALLLAGITPPLLRAMDRQVAENPLYYRGGLGKAAVVQEVVCNVGMVENRISNSPYEKGTGTLDWTILIGDDSAELPSMLWKTPSLYAENNHYLFYASLRIGYQGHQIHLAEDRFSQITVTSPGDSSLFETEMYTDDQSNLTPPQYKIGVGVRQKTHAWSEAYRDDFIIYDYWVYNLNDEALDSVFVGIHNDADVSTAEGGAGDQAWSIDDLPGYYRDDVNKEYISYVYDGDNPSVPGDDRGGRRTPKESAGYIGSRLLYAPPLMGGTAADTTMQTGHGWWDWNNDPSEAEGWADWIQRLSDGVWMGPPPSPFDYRYYQKTGPFSIPGNDSIRIVFAFGIGEGLDGLRANLEWADYLYEHAWIGASSPTPPDYALEPGDGQVTITWDTRAETSIDPFSGEADFEGYRVWKRAATGWSLLMECDLVNEIGFNTGLVHSYVDYDVNNYFQYTYAVTAYDKGDVANNIESLESGVGVGQTVEPGSYDLTRNSAKSGIHVVPNPFVAKSARGFGFTPTQNNPATERIVFVNLPPNSTVRIYTLTGDLITTIRNIQNTAYADSTSNGWQTTASWDLISDNMQTIVSGLYLYVVETPGEEDFIDKFAVIR